MPRDVDGVIDEIDRLVDAQLKQEASGYDHNINQPECWHCGRPEHHLKITERIEQMRAQRHYDETYRASEDNSPVLCPGSDFIGPMPPPKRITTVHVGQRTPGEWLNRVIDILAAIGVELPQLMPELSALGYIPPTRERWWRIQVRRSRAHGYRRQRDGRTRLVIADQVAFYPTENVVVQIRGDRRLTIDVLAETAPTLGGTPPPHRPGDRRPRQEATRWEPIAAPGVTCHPDTGPLRRTGPNPWDYVFDPQEGDRVSFQTSAGMLTGVVAEANNNRPHVREYTIRPERQGYALDYLQLDGNTEGECL